MREALQNSSGPWPNSRRHQQLSPNVPVIIAFDSISSMPPPSRSTAHRSRRRTHCGAQHSNCRPPPFRSGLSFTAFTVPYAFTLVDVIGPIETRSYGGNRLIYVAVYNSTGRGTIYIGLNKTGATTFISDYFPRHATIEQLELSTTFPAIMSRGLEEWL